MNTTKLGRLLTLGIFTALAAPQAQAAKLAILDAHILGGWTGVAVSGTGSEKNVTSSKTMSYGLGVGVELPLAESLGIVTGIDYLHRKFEVGFEKARIERTVPTVIIPVMVRAWIGDAFYVQGGVYGSKGVGDVKDTFKSGNKGLIGFDSQARRGVDFGGVAGLGLNLAMFGKTGVYMQGQYLHGFSNSSSASVYKERVRDLLVSTGVRIEL